MASLLKSILSHNSGGMHNSPSFSDLSMGASADGALLLSASYIIELIVLFGWSSDRRGFATTHFLMRLNLAESTTVALTR